VKWAISSELVLAWNVTRREAGMLFFDLTQWVGCRTEYGRQLSLSCLGAHDFHKEELDDESLFRFFHLRHDVKLTSSRPSLFFHDSVSCLTENYPSMKLSGMYLLPNNNTCFVIIFLLGEIGVRELFYALYCEMFGAQYRVFGKSILWRHFGYFRRLYDIWLDWFLDILSISGDSCPQPYFLLAQYRSDLLPWDSIQNSLNVLLKLLEASLLASTEALLDGREKIEIIWCHIRGIERMRHSCKSFDWKNYVIVFELWAWNCPFGGIIVFVMVFLWKVRVFSKARQ
jgi:hypothetical protein